MISEWKTIDSAPLDGTPILAAGGHPDGSSDYSEWSEDDDNRIYSHPSKVVVIWRDDIGWRYCSYDSRYYGEWEDPTHWMPLPEPPEAE